MAINNRFESKSSAAEHRTSKRGDDQVENASYRQVDKPTGRQSTETRIEKSTEKSANILLKPPVKSAPMKSTGWPPQWTSNDDYRVKQNLRVNATYQ